MFDTKIDTKEIAEAIMLLASLALKPENIKSITDRKGVTHSIQLGLVLHTEQEKLGKYGDNETPSTLIKFVNDKWVRVALTAKELAEQLDCAPKEVEFYKQD
ncbi:hypothetical protein RRK67_004055 [Vibrio fluvialis]|nr:hypothetical protein [Vibrio fluvialis]